MVFSLVGAIRRRLACVRVRACVRERNCVCARIYAGRYIPMMRSIQLLWHSEALAMEITCVIRHISKLCVRVCLCGSLSLSGGESAGENVFGEIGIVTKQYNAKMKIDLYRQLWLTSI